MFCPKCFGELANTPRCPHCAILLTGPTATKLWETDQQILKLEHDRTQLQQVRKSLLATLEKESGPAPALIAPQQNVQRSIPPENRFTGQQILLGLGAVLVVFAIFIFSAVNWETIGVAGQLILMLGLILTLGKGTLLAFDKKLRQTAEALSVATIGVLAVTMGLAGTLTNLPGSTWFLCAATIATLGAGALRYLRRPILSAGALFILGSYTTIFSTLWAFNVEDSWWAVLVTLLGVSGVYARKLFEKSLSKLTLGVGALLAAAGALTGIVQGYTDTKLGSLLGSAALLIAAGALYLWGKKQVKEGSVPKPSYVVSQIVATSLSGVLTGVALHIIVHDEGSAVILTAGVLGAILAGVSLHLKPKVFYGTLGGVLAALAAGSGNAGDGALILLVGSLAALYHLYREPSVATAIILPITVPLAIVAGSIHLDISLTIQLLLIAAIAASITVVSLTFETYLQRTLEYTAWTVGLVALAEATTLNPMTFAAIMAVLSGALWLIYVFKKHRLYQIFAAATFYIASCAAIYSADSKVTVALLLLAGVAAASTLHPSFKPNRIVYEVFSVILIILALLETDAALILVATLWVSALIIILHSLQKDRGLLAPAGVLLASAGNATLFLENDVTLLEYYTLPAAAGFLLVGFIYQKKRSGTSVPSSITTGPATAIALIPSALLALEDGGIRVLLTLLAAAGVLAASLIFRHRAPFIFGSVIVIVLGWQLLGPVAAEIPRWITLLVVGAGLLAVGATYEKQLNALRKADQWVKDMH